MVGGSHPLRSRRIVLTGASRGLGRALALAFHEAGADLFLVARRSTEFEDMLAEIDRTRPGALDYWFADLIDAAPVIDAIREYAPDVLVNNAARQGPIGPIWTIPAAAWQQTLALDLATPAALIGAVLPGMIERRSGVLINVSGGGATSSRPNFSAYAAAKAGLVRLTECVADEVREHGIAVTAVAPGAMPTRLLQEIAAAGAARAGAAEVANAERVLEIDPDETADAIRALTEFCIYLAAAPRLGLSGRLIAPRWDDWRVAASLPADMFKLRRVEPAR